MSVLPSPWCGCRWRIPNREQPGGANELNELAGRFHVAGSLRTRGRGQVQSVDTSRLRCPPHSSRTLLTPVGFKNLITLPGLYSWTTPPRRSRRWTRAPLCRRQHPRTCRARRRETQRSMWPVTVVMLHEDVKDPVGFTNLITPPGRARAPPTDRDSGREPRPTQSPDVPIRNRYAESQGIGRRIGSELPRKSDEPRIAIPKFITASD